MGGSAPTSTPVQIQPPIYPSGYGFSEALYGQVLPELLNTPYPRFQGSVDPGLSPTMAALIRGGQTHAASPFSPTFNQAGSTLGGMMNVNYENPLASTDPNRYGFEYNPGDFGSLGQSPGMPRSVAQAAEMMGPQGGVTSSPSMAAPSPSGAPPGGKAPTGNRVSAGNEEAFPPNERPPGGPPANGAPGGGPGPGPGGPEHPPEPGVPAPNEPPPFFSNGRPQAPDLNFTGFPAYTPIRGGEGFVDYNPGSNVINIGPGMRAGSYSSNPMPAGPFPGPPPGAPPPGGGQPPGSPPAGPPGGPPVSNFDPRQVVPQGQLEWFGQWKGPNRGKSLEQVHFDMWTRGWDMGNYQPPQALVDAAREAGQPYQFNSKPTTMAEVVMKNPARGQGPTSGFPNDTIPGGQRVTGGSGAPAGGK